MKKTPFINLVLITAALAACNRPLYQQVDVTEDDTDSSSYCNNCLMLPPDLPPSYYTWYYGFRPYGCYYDESLWFVDNPGLFVNYGLTSGPWAPTNPGIWHHGHAIARGGFGRAGHTVSA